MESNARGSSRLERTGKHLVLIFMVLVTLFPVIFVFKLAFSGDQQLNIGLVPWPDQQVLCESGGPVDQASQLCCDDGSDPIVSDAGSMCANMQVPNVEPIRSLSLSMDNFSEFVSGTLLCDAGGPVDRVTGLCCEDGGPTRASPMGPVCASGSGPSIAPIRSGTGLFLRQFLNSLVVSICTTILGIFLATTAAYALSRFRFPGRRTALFMFLVSQMFPGTLMLIPIYVILQTMGLLNNLLGLVLVYSTTAIPFCVWMLKGYFDTIPVTLEESARIDGASPIVIFYKIILPLARPAIAVTALFSFMTAWNEFILAATFMDAEAMYTLPVVLKKLVGEFGGQWGTFAAGSIIVSIPIVLLFYWLQKYLVGGLTAGSVKG